MKKVKYISLFLGTTIFMFGFLKLFNPFSHWVADQVRLSGLPSSSVITVIIGEIVTGIAFVLPFIFPRHLQRHRILLLMASNISIIVMMAFAIYVHSHPAVPEEILPLKMKGPQIPLVYIVAAVINVGYTLKQRQRKSYEISQAKELISKH